MIRHGKTPGVALSMYASRLEATGACGVKDVGVSWNWSPRVLVFPRRLGTGRAEHSCDRTTRMTHATPSDTIA